MNAHSNSLDDAEGTPVMNRRRALFAATGAIASIGAVGAATAAFASTGSRTLETIDDRIRRLAGELSAALEGMHGGEWRVTVNHEQGVALIIQQREVQS